MENKKIAMLIDSDNTPHSKLKLIVDELTSYGQIIVKRAYGDFSIEQLKNWKKPLNELAIQARQQFSYTTGKNSTDALMIIETMDLLYTGRFDVFALVSSDSDFTSLATRLRESEIYVIGVGKGTTPLAFKNACDSFITLENLDGKEDIMNEEQVSLRRTSETDREIWRLMHQAWQNYRDDSGWARLGEVGGYLKRLKPDFDSRNYGLAKLSDFFETFPNRYKVRNTKQLGVEFQLVTKANKQGNE